MDDKKLMKTGTTTVGLVAKDAIVLAADKRATAGNFIADKKTEKIVKINDYLALTTAGSVSDIQMITKLIRAELALKDIRTDREASVKEASNLLAGIVYGNIRRLSMIPSVVHFLIAGKDDSGNYIFDIYPDGSVTKIEKFVASGSGSMFAYGIFEAQYNKDISQDQAVELAVKAVNSAMQRDSASGDGIDVAVVSSQGVKKLMTKQVEKTLKNS
ncbi:proteasome subunit beta [Candidatus Woesearchaeota archaeon]|nr:proteasome subunit beta [Candidatus Woesearchaeota archaeon]